jgi:hypothetical protein
VHKAPKDVARSLRAFKTAHMLGLLHQVSIVPGTPLVKPAIGASGFRCPGAKGGDDAEGDQ